MKYLQNRTQNKLWTTDFVILLFMSFFNMFCMQFNTASLAPWVSAIGLSSSYTGLFTLCFTLPSIVGCFVWGRLSQKTGRRVIILTGSLAFGICAAMIPAAAPIVAIIAVLRIIQGVGYSAVNNGMAATQADVITPERLGEGIGFFGIAQSITLVIGPGSALLVIEHFGFSPVFGVIAALCILIFILCLLLRVNISASAIRQSLPDEAPMQSPTGKGLWLFLEKSSLLPCIFLLLAMAALGSTNFYAATYAADLGIAGASLFFVIYALADVLTIAAIGKLSDRLPMRLLVLPGMVLSAIGLFWLSMVESSTMFLLSSIPIGVGTGLIVPVIQAAAFRGVPKHRRGMASATYYVAFDGGMCLGALLWGIVQEQAGFQSVYRGAALLMVLTIIVCAVTAMRKPRTAVIEEADDK